MGVLLGSREGERGRGRRRGESREEEDGRTMEMAALLVYLGICIHISYPRGRRETELFSGDADQSKKCGMSASGGSSLRQTREELTISSFLRPPSSLQPSLHTSAVSPSFLEHVAIMARLLR